MSNLVSTTCCGLREFEATEKMSPYEVIKKCALILVEQRFTFILFSGSDENFSLEDVGKFIKKHELGEVVQTGSKNGKSFAIWGVNRAKITEWQQKHGHTLGVGDKVTIGEVVFPAYERYHFVQCIFSRNCQLPSGNTTPVFEIIQIDFTSALISARTVDGREITFSVYPSELALLERGGPVNEPSA